MRRQSVISIALAASVFLCAGCPEPPGPLEIGIQDEDTGEFMPLHDDDPVAVVLGANGLNMIVPSLRAEGIDPSGPDPDITVSVGGILMAAVIQGENTDMESRDGMYVLWGLRVPFQTNLCCYNCAPGVISARLEDQSGNAFEGEVRIQLSRNGTCPDVAVCCADLSACEDPTYAQVCE